MTVLIELDTTAKHIVINAEWRFKELCKSIPGSSWSTKESVWTVPTSWTSCLALRATFKTDLEIGPKLTKWATDELANRINPSMLYRDIETTEDGDADLFPHQRAGVRYLATAKRALLADEPGLGKTAQAIRALKFLDAQGYDVFPAMIVCPNSLKKNWAREFATWWPGVNVQVIHGTSIQRRKQLLPLTDRASVDPEPTPDVIVMNWEALRSHSRLAPFGSVSLARCPDCKGHDEKVTPARCEVHERELNKIDFKAVVADEIHRSKDPKSKQTRALWAATGDAEYRFAMTGTPVANNVVDMWAILHWLSPEEWPSKTKWIDRFVDVMLNAFGGMTVLGIKPAMEKEFQATVYPRMRRMLKAKVLPFLPEIVYERRDVEMHPKQKKAYNQMRDSMIAELEDGSGDSEYMTAPSVLTQTTRLLQFASSYAELHVDPITLETKATLSEPSSKIDALIGDIAAGDFGSDSVAVSSVSRQMIDLLSARLTKDKIPHGLITGAQSADERQQAVDDFQSGKTKWVLFTVQAGGVGITLTAARRLIRIQRPYSLVDDKQANDRVHRIGSEIHDSIIITDYIVSGTVEEVVIKILEAKAANFEQVVKDKDTLLSMLKADKAGEL